MLPLMYGNTSLCWHLLERLEETRGEKLRKATPWSRLQIRAIHLPKAVGVSLISIVELALTALRVALSIAFTHSVKPVKDAFKTTVVSFIYDVKLLKDPYISIYDISLQIFGPTIVPSTPQISSD